MASPSPTRVLLVLPQLPHDPASGAARSTTAIAELLADSGFLVRALAASASEGSTWEEPVAYLNSLGVATRIEPATSRMIRPTVGYRHRNIEHRVLHVGRRRVSEWQRTLAKPFDYLFDDELDTFRPDLVITFGGLPSDIRRLQRARRRGCRIVFSLRNLGYLHREFFKHVDSVLTPSAFLTERYRETIGIESTPILAPLDLADVVAPSRDPIFVTMVNPSLAKGAMLFARIAEDVSLRNPRIPFLVVESRGSAGTLVRAGLAGGFDLRRHRNIMFSPAVGRPRDIFAPTRVLVAPSLVEEAGGRIPAEALLNSVPPIVSDRGGLPEVCRDGGFVVPVPAAVQANATKPVSSETGAPWVSKILELCEDGEAYQKAAARAKEAARHHLPETLRPQYVEYFNRVLS